MKKQGAMAGALAISLVSASPAQAADSATTTITATITAVCEVSMPAVITMPDIPYDKVPPPDKASKEYGKNFTIKGSCSGGGNFRYAFTTPAVTSRFGCIKTNPDGVLGLCLYGPEDKPYSFVNQELFINNPPPELTLTLVPLGQREKKVSAYSAMLSVKIEPM